MRLTPFSKILLTGLPGCGKTTAVMRILEKLEGVKAAGFYTEEIRQGDKRKGFRWKRLDGAEGILASADIKGKFRVGRYGVDVAGFERDVVPVLNSERGDVSLFVIDEIGKMECLSQKFADAARRLFAGEKPVLATVARKGGGFIAEVKEYPAAKLFTLTERSRDLIVDEILELLSASKSTGVADG
jgi:nucleoside-triphosphatase